MSIFPIFGGRTKKSLKRKVVAVSGGMDPIHAGHIRYIKEARKLGDYLVVILNSDKFLLRKKGYVFMPIEERIEILQNIIGVDEVFPCIDIDDSVCKSLTVIRPDIFAKGGDRTKDNIPEVKVCEENGIKMIFGVGGIDKPQSSSWLIERFVLKLKKHKELRKKYGLHG